MHLIFCMLFLPQGPLSICIHILQVSVGFSPGSQDSSHCPKTCNMHKRQFGNSRLKQLLCKWWVQMVVCLYVALIKWPLPSSYNSSSRLTWPQVQQTWLLKMNRSMDVVSQWHDCTGGTDAVSVGATRRTLVAAQMQKQVAVTWLLKKSSKKVKWHFFSKQNKTINLPKHKSSSLNCLSTVQTSFST